jgi:hypothetical protein
MISNLLTYYVNTGNKQPNSSDTDNFYYQFDIDNSLIEHLTNVSITKISLPKTYYVVPDGLNYFTLYENSVPILIIIPFGDYTNLELFSMLQYQMNTSTLNSIVYSVFEVTNLNTPPIASLISPPIPDLYRIAITAINPSNIPISLFFDNITLLDAILGMNQGYNYFDIATNTYIIAPMLYNLNTQENIYLLSDCISNITNDSTIGNSAACVIQTGNVQYGSYVNQEYDIIANMKKFNKKGKVFHFHLVNEFNSPSFNINEIDLSFVINFFTYTPNLNYYSKSLQLMNLLIEK